MVLPSSVTDAKMIPHSLADRFRKDTFPIQNIPPDTNWRYSDFLHTQIKQDVFNTNSYGIRFSRIQEYLKHKQQIK